LPAVTAAPTTTQFMSLPSPTGLISIDNVPSPSKASVTNPVGIFSNAFNCFFEGLFQFFLIVSGFGSSIIFMSSPLKLRRLLISSLYIAAPSAHHPCQVEIVFPVTRILQIHFAQGKYQYAFLLTKPRP